MKVKQEAYLVELSDFIGKLSCKPCLWVLPEDMVEAPEHLTIKGLLPMESYFA